MTGLPLALAGLALIAGAPPTTPEDDTTTMRVILDDTRIIALSPDGQLLVGHTSNSLCVYEVPTPVERVCADLDGAEISIDDNSVVWSPDSSAVAFTETTFITLVDGDLWTMDASTGELSNLTDDDFEGRWAGPDTEDTGPSTPIHVDVLPAWAPDGASIAFSRSSVVDGEPTGNAVATVDVAGGGVESLIEVTTDVPGVVYFGLTWAPSGAQLYYSVTHPDPDEPQNGVWAFDVASGEAEQLLPADPDKGPPALTQVAATEQTALIFYPLLAGQGVAQSDYFALLDLESNALAAVDPAITDEVPHDVVRVVTFSPEGTRVLFGLQQFEGSASSLQVRELPDGKSSVVLESESLPIMSTVGRGLFWADDGTVFAATGPNEGVLLHLD